MILLAADMVPSRQIPIRVAMPESNIAKWRRRFYGRRLEGLIDSDRQAHPRFVAHHSPPHASWVNHAELFLSMLQHKVINNGSCSKCQDLLDKLIRLISEYDQSAKPFRWTYAADPVAAVSMRAEVPRGSNGPQKPMNAPEWPKRQKLPRKSDAPQTLQVKPAARASRRFRRSL